MVPDWQTNFVLFSDLLPARHPVLWAGLVGILDQAGVGHRLIEGTRDVWVRDLLPVQVAAADFVLFRYEPDYLGGREDLIPSDEARRAALHGACLRTSDL